MKETIKKFKLNVTLSAALAIVVGVMLLLFPEASIMTVGKILAVIVILSGIAVVVGQVMEYGTNVMGIVVGAVITIIGIWMFAKPAAIMQLIPIAIGVILVVHGITDFSLAIEETRASVERAWIPYLVAVVNILLGFVCIGYAFGFVSLAFRLIGVMLIFDGLSDLGIVHKVRKAGGVVDSTIISEEDIF